MTSKEYKTITDIKGPLVFLEKTEPVAYGEIVTIRLSDGSMKNGQVLDTSDDAVIVQVFEGTEAIDRQAGVKFLGDVFKLPVSRDLVGRILDGAGRPRVPPRWLRHCDHRAHRRGGRQRDAPPRREGAR